MTEQYRIFEVELKGTEEGNPYTDVWLEADFANGEEKVRVNGFYCGNGSYKIRFMPGKTGKWSAVTKSNDFLLNGIPLECVCTAAKAENHGRVLPMSQVQHCSLEKEEEHRFRFSYEDGTEFFPFGTTCYAWIHQPEEIRKQTLESLRKTPFNKVRMCVFPKYYDYNKKNPKDYPFMGSLEEGFDLTCFHPAFWEKLEECILKLDQLGIEADLILFHPYDKWGFSKMDRETDLAYLRYAVDRLCHYKNVWWSLANEYDLLPWKTVEAWEAYGETVMKRDPYGHLRSIHNCSSMYDYTRSWITHASIQRIDVYKTAENITEWRAKYQKPIVVDECAYEGNINYGWGNITGEEMTRRFWEGCMRGGYLTHGEVFVQNPYIWWSHGGRLYGNSPERIAFLRKIMEQAPSGSAPLKLTPENHQANWDAPCFCREQDKSFYLYYFGFSQPSFRSYELPEGCRYEIELIDTWNMSIDKLPGVYEGRVRIEMPGRQYMAIRMKRV
ncbi:MAG: DUF5605 domain-containing protein [Eubacteriales bacterium]|nr:DUF5605 domain-containing protein [Eubacteriales bacterium]